MSTAALAVVVALAGSAVLAGCGTGAARPPAVGQRQPPGALSLATAVTGRAMSWAVVRLTGSGGRDNRFWQLLVRSSGSQRWRLATPPGVADTGGLAVAESGRSALTAGFVPSELLKFTPLAISGDGGTRWSQGLLPAGLAAEPGALAALPDGRLAAITGPPGRRSAELSDPAGTSWSALITQHALAASSAGRRCGLTDLTAVAANPAGRLVLAGTCARPGLAGIFGQAWPGWQAAGPAVPASLAGQRISVLRLAPDGTAALLAAGTSRGLSLVPAWLAGHSATWTVGLPVDLQRHQVLSASAGAGGRWGVVLSQDRGEIIGPPGAGPPALLPLPAGTAVLLPDGHGATAIAPADSSITIWRLTGGRAWRKAQQIAVPLGGGLPG